MTKRILSVLAMLSIAAMMMLSSCTTETPWKEFTFSFKIYNETNCPLTVQAIEVGASAYSSGNSSCIKNEVDDLPNLDDSYKVSFNKEIDAKGTTVSKADFSIKVKYDSDVLDPIYHGSNYIHNDLPFFYVHCEFFDGISVKIPYAGNTTDGEIVKYTKEETTRNTRYEYKGETLLKFCLTEGGDYVLVQYE